MPRRHLIVDETACPPVGALCTVPGLGPLQLHHATCDQGPQIASRQGCHRHAVFHAVLFTRGGGHFQLDERDRAVQAPMLVLCDPDRLHAFSLRPGGTAHYDEVTFSAARVGGWQRLMTAWSGLALEVPTTVPVDATVCAALRLPIHEMVAAGQAAGPHRAALLQGHLAQFLFALYRHVLAVGGGVDVLERARLRLERDPAVDLAGLAGDCGWSAKHFLRLFTRRYGLPPMRYRTRAVLERARVLLRTTDYPIKAVAGLCGFADVRHFHRRYRAEHGRTPGSERRAAQGGGGAGGI